MKVLGVITARGGSKGIPRKNIRMLCGRPLLEYTTAAALAARRLDRVILSTDDREIADVGRRCGIEVPFIRPENLADDRTPTLPVLQHAVEWLERTGSYYDAICLLQPTHPMRTALLIDACINLFVSSGAESVVTILPVPTEYNPHWVYFKADDGYLHLSTGEIAPIEQRQSLPAACHREGSVYVTQREVLMRKNSLYGTRLVGYPMDPSESVNLDTSSDWERAAALLANR